MSNSAVSTTNEKPHKAKAGFFFSSGGCTHSDKHRTEIRTTECSHRRSGDACHDTQHKYDKRTTADKNIQNSTAERTKEGICPRDHYDSAPTRPLQAGRTSRLRQIAAYEAIIEPRQLISICSPWFVIKPSSSRTQVGTVPACRRCCQAMASKGNKTQGLARNLLTEFLLLDAVKKTKTKKQWLSPRRTR